MEKTSPKILFDPSRRAQKLERAKKTERRGADFLAKIAADTLVDRLGAVNRSFRHAIDVDSLFDCMTDMLEAHPSVGEVTKIGGLSRKVRPAIEIEKFEAETVELVASVLGLHWQNALPSMLAKLHAMLKPDGLFIAAVPGDRTLNELRSVLIEAETQTTGAVSLRVDPFGEVRQYGAMLQSAGFALPVVDTEIITARYDSIHDIVADLRSWGGTSSLSSRPPALRRKTVELAEQIYREKFADPDGRLRASFELVFMHGWKPHASQQKPLPRGSAKMSLEKALSKKATR